MKKSPVILVVAIGVGAALFFVLGRFVAIPSPVPNTNISTQYGLLAFMAALFGPVAGALIVQRCRVGDADGVHPAGTEDVILDRFRQAHCPVLHPSSM